MKTSQSGYDLTRLTDAQIAKLAEKFSPEERHVSNMQSTGYENPTYKYFYEVHA